MSIAMFSAFGVLLAGVCLGFFIAKLLQMTDEAPAPVATSNDEPAAIPPMFENDAHLHLLVNYMQELTMQLGSNVGRHSTRVSEITDAMESPGRILDSAAILTAGQALIAANRILETDLQKANLEIALQRQQMEASIRESRTDMLTELPNRRAFVHELNRAFSDYRRTGLVFSLVLIDIDHFKRFNDDHGHEAGDQTLKYFARCLHATFRETDFVARFGGEEFAVILPHTELKHAIPLVQRVCESVMERQFSVGKIALSVTASFGVTEVTGEECDTQLIERTDEALYAAKAAGRNRVCYNDGAMSIEYVAEPTSEFESSPCEDEAVCTV